MEVEGGVGPFIEALGDLPHQRGRFSGLGGLGRIVEASRVDLGQNLGSDFVLLGNEGSGSLALLDPVEAEAVGDREQPAPEALGGFELVEPLHGTHERVLGDVGGIGAIPQQPDQEVVDRRKVPVVESGERFTVSASGGGDEIGIALLALNSHVAPNPGPEVTRRIRKENRLARVRNSPLVGRTR